MTPNNPHTRIKICGLTNLADAQLAVEVGADLLGFIFYEKSPRYVQPEVVAQIVKDIRLWHGAARPLPKLVGVFVNQNVASIAQTLAFAQLDYAQLHGDETPETLRQLLRQLQGRAYKAIRPVDSRQAQIEAERYVQGVDDERPALLIDAYHAQAYGGTGRRADWRGATQVAAHTPGLLLAGGLNSDNVVEAISMVRPWGVDVSGGVEQSPGQKDAELVRRFVEAVRAIRDISN